MEINGKNWPGLQLFFTVACPLANRSIAFAISRGSCLLYVLKQR